MIWNTTTENDPLDRCLTRVKNSIDTSISVFSIHILWCNLFESMNEWMNQASMQQSIALNYEITVILSIM